MVGWFSRKMSNKAKTFPLSDTHGEQLIPSPTPTPPSQTPTFGKPRWFSRSKTVPISRSLAADGFPAMSMVVQRRLKPEEEYNRLSDSRKEAEKARVMELQLFLASTRRWKRPVDNARSSEVAEAEVTVEHPHPVASCSNEDYADAS
jgi:hypothetical protein